MQAFRFYKDNEEVKDDYYIDVYYDIGSTSMPEVVKKLLTYQHLFEDFQGEFKVKVMNLTGEIYANCYSIIGEPKYCKKSSRKICSNCYEMHGVETYIDRVIKGEPPFFVYSPCLRSYHNLEEHGESIN